MKNILAKLRKCILVYVACGWPIVLADVALDAWRGEPATLWRHVLNDAGFAWVLCAAAALAILALDKNLRERAMAWLCGVREGDERERAVTGEAARAAFLLGLSLQVVLLVMTMVNVRLSWNPHVPQGEKHGLLQVGMGFSKSQHLNPFGVASDKSDYIGFGTPPALSRGNIDIAGGYLLAPSAFPVLLLLILVQLGAFRIFAGPRYEGMDA